MKHNGIRVIGVCVKTALENLKMKLQLFNSKALQLYPGSIEEPYFFLIKKLYSLFRNRSPIEINYIPIFLVKANAVKLTAHPPKKSMLLKSSLCL